MKELKHLSKALDCLLHDLLNAKLVVYGFDYSSLLLLQNYLSNRKQRTKVNNTYSTLSDIMFKVQYWALYLLIFTFLISFLM